MGHSYQNPARRWDVLAGLAQQIDAKTFVEVGCKEGRTTGFMLEKFPELLVTAIDPWAPIANDDEDYSTWDYAAIERDFWQNVGPHTERCYMWRMLSLEAAPKLRDGSVDLVFIDAGHDYDNALEDIKAWWPKVRPGGMLTGHDYQHTFPGVMRAVAKAFPLIRVAVMPDSVWCVQKDADVRLVA